MQADKVVTESDFQSKLTTVNKILIAQVIIFALQNTLFSIFVTTLYKSINSIQNANQQSEEGQMIQYNTGSSHDNNAMTRVDQFCHYYLKGLQE